MPHRGKSDQSSMADQSPTPGDSCQPIPMAQWVEMEPPGGEEATGLCHPCALPLTAHEYQDILRQGGQKQIAAELKKLSKSDAATPSTIAAALDNIKTRVPSSLAQRLLALDCEVQRELASANNDEEE